MTHRFGILRRFRFNLPQRIAAALLALFLIQGLWLTGRQTLTDRDYQYARCGREIGTWELRHQMTHILLLLRLPFLFAGCLLGGCIWWVTRRLYGNFGGYTALALYCFSPAVLKACVAPNAELLAALGVYGGVYTCIGVAHAMQGPRRKWRPRMVLLTLLFGVAATSHIAALPVVALLGLVLMLWVAEGHRSQALPVVLTATAGALVLLFICYGFSPDAFSYVFRSAAGFLWFSLNPARRFFTTMGNAGITVAT